MRHKLLPVLLATVLTSGCSYLYRQPVFQGNLLEPTSVEQLQAGMDRQQVLALLGTPSISDPFHHDRWDYTATERVGRRDQTQIKNLTVYFDNDKVVRWEGESFPERDAQLSRDVIRYYGPNLRDDDKKRRQQ